METFLQSSQNRSSRLVACAGNQILRLDFGRLARYRRAERLDMVEKGGGEWGGKKSRIEEKVSWLSRTSFSSQTVWRRYRRQAKQPISFCPSTSYFGLSFLFERRPLGLWLGIKRRLPTRTIVYGRKFGLVPYDKQHSSILLFLLNRRLLLSLSLVLCILIPPQPAPHGSETLAIRCDAPVKSYIKPDCRTSRWSKWGMERQAIHFSLFFSRFLSLVSLLVFPSFLVQHKHEQVER